MKSGVLNDSLEPFTSINFKGNKMNTNTKPPVIEVTRFYRPRYDDYSFMGYSYAQSRGEIISDRGVTVIFTLDYDQLTYVAKWSICNGDNFSKTTGVQYAQACSNPVVGKIIKDVPLRELIMGDLVNIFKEEIEIDAHNKISNRVAGFTDFPKKDYPYNKTQYRNLYILGEEIYESITI